MAPRTGNYSRFIYSEAKRYLAVLMQQGVPVVDADWNDYQEAFITFMRRFLQFSVGDGSPNDGFKIEESGTSNVNNFTIKGGDGSNEGAGRIFAGGFPGMLVSDVDYVSTSIDIHPIVVSRTDTVLTDTAANYDVDELVGRDLVPDITIPASTFTILSNTATTITVAGGLNLATSARKHYRINPSTPSGGGRNDEVYVDMWLDEISSDDDSNLIHAFVVPTEAARRLLLRQVIKIKEGGTTPADFIDSDGNQHITLKLATLARLNGDNTVTTAMITDDRLAVGDFATIKNEVANARNSVLLGAFGALDDRLEALEDIQVDAPITRSIDVSPAKIRLSIPQATTGVDGYLDSTDYDTFNDYPSDTTPLPVGPTADAGDATQLSRDNHVHAIPYESSAPLQPSGLTGDAGSSDDVSRGNHRHPGANADENLKVIEDSPAANTVEVQPGTFNKSDGSGIVEITSNLTSPVFTAVGAQPRIDVLTINDSGTLEITAGAEAASPTPPSYPASKLPLAEILINEVSPASVVINTADITDVRPLLRNQAASTGQTDTITATLGLVNSGDNINAVIQPATNKALAQYGATSFEGTPAVLAAGSGGPLSLADGSITIPANQYRFFVQINFEAVMTQDVTSPGGAALTWATALDLEIANPSSFNDISFYNGQRILAYVPVESNFTGTITYGGSYSGSIILSISESPAFDPTQALTVRWKEVVRVLNPGASNAVTVDNRRITVWGI